MMSDNILVLISMYNDDHQEITARVTFTLVIVACCC